jgi:MOSC domain-containing protein YiiM
MWKGSVVGITISAEGSGPMVAVEQVNAVAGQGLEGDRYFLKQGTFTNNENVTGRQVTLIESESIEALEHESGITIAAKDARRNIVTKDVPLNHLVGREFCVGSVRMRGVRLSEPCLHMAALVDEANKDTIRLALLHRAGLRADILNDGTIRVGDEIVRE